MTTLRACFALFAACGVAFPLSAQPTVAELRRAADDILSGDEFQHFDHFERQPHVAPEVKPAQQESAAPSEAPWWERARKSRGKKAESRDTTGSKSSSGASGTPGQSSIKPNTAHESTAPGNESPRDAAQPAAAPSQPGRDRGPAQRGSDGVERPVRHPLKTSHIESKSSWPDWEFGGWLGGIGQLLGLSLQLIAYLVLAAVVVLILALAGRAVADAWQGRRRRGVAGDAALAPLAHDRSPGETAADVFLQQALALAGQGAYRAALGQLMLGAMSCIERRDWIRYRRGLTVRDYLRSVRSRSEQYDGLKSVVDVYEPAEYGRIPATQTDFNRALAGYRAGFERAPAASN